MVKNLWVIFRDGSYFGQGTLVDSKGNRYIGKYKNNKRNGKGINIYANGNKYVGEVKNDFKAWLWNLYLG